jgi:hypothetical protein
VFYGKKASRENLAILEMEIMGLAMLVSTRLRMDHDAFSVVGNAHPHANMRKCG